MVHQAGWIELYSAIASGTYNPESIELCKSSKTRTGEIMLHWYAIESEPYVLEQLIALGFNVNI